MRLSLGLLGAAILLSAPLRAGSGTTESWLSGTQAWDTSPYKEADLELYADGADGRPDLGTGAQIGLQEWLQAGIEGRWLLDGSAAPLRLTLQAREPYYRDFPRFDGPWRLWDLVPPMALLGRWDRDGAQWVGSAGLIIAIHPLDRLGLSGIVNLEAGSGGLLFVRAGLWSPYLLPMLRAGLEMTRRAATAAGPEQGLLWTPQILLNGPGDLSFSLGVELDAEQSRPARWLTRLSYQLFQNP